MINKCFFFLFVLCSTLCTAVFSQKSSQKKGTQQGFDFFFNAGMYLGNKANANYYGGDPGKDPDPDERKYGDPNIAYVLKNPYWSQDILNIIDRNNNDVIADEFWLEEISGMRYNLAFSFGVGARYRFSESFMLSFLFSQTRLTAEGIATLSMKTTGINPDIGGIKYFDANLIGKERRNFFGINASFLFITTIPYVFPFLELGVHMNSTKVLSSELVVEEELRLSMINWYGEGTVYDPGFEYPRINPNLGGIGFGIIGGLGVRLTFNQWAAIEPVVQVSVEKVNLSSYDKMRPNFNFMVRLVIGDKVFSKK
jgi:hypothetical protein